MRLKWARAASQDLESVETVLEIIRRVETLAEHPGMGRPGRVGGTRELVLGGLVYVIPYIHQADTVIILRVLHGAMKWTESFEGAGRPPGLDGVAAASRRLPRTRTNRWLITNKPKAPNTANDPEQSSTKSRKTGG